jgi:hypothetical protein
MGNQAGDHLHVTAAPAGDRAGISAHMSATFVAAARPKATHAPYL